jgi:hypothetical protein
MSTLTAEEMGRDAASPSPPQQKSSPPYSAPSTISISFSIGLSTADVETTIVIASDCRQPMSGLWQWAAVAEAVSGRCVWWEVWWEVRC